MVDSLLEDCITYFGYGSLVNRATRASQEAASPARLYGWQRVWGHRVSSVSLTDKTANYHCCSLSVQKLDSSFQSHDKPVQSTPTGALSGMLHNASQSPDNRQHSDQKHGYIDGVIANIALSELPMLDKRESGYDRVAVPASAFELPEHCKASEVHVYVSDASHSGRANDQYPILQSYIDCVLAGYCDLYDRDGMQQFVDSTLGWEGAIKNDRESPLYPRAVTLAPSQLAEFDELVKTRRLLRDG